MKKITANTLQETITQAANEFGCSVTEIEYEVIQYESKGFLGFGKKQAIIIANMTNATNTADTTLISHAQKPNSSYQSAYQSTHKNPHQNPRPNTYQAAPHIKQSESKTPSQDTSHQTNQTNEFFDASEFINQTHQSLYQPPYQSLNRPSTQPQNQHTTKEHKLQTKQEVIDEITAHIKEMFSYMPYKIDKIEVSFFDAQTLYIFLDGADSALLIGERGYRYKAFSYLLFNWIQPTYGYNVRLEIAEFLKNQEEAIDSYLVGIIHEVKREGRAQTKPLDGILAFIALKKLREVFPDKYISFRQNNQNERYIIINDFYR
ncbi:Jag N-terminal domain-containing protein [uncultured Helicobacter sp.]|uniref:Jag N-terminal domain-containing protein n=1 Tax=uncultured Helicobacter sp. TaxID=175537 RepID=UPI002594477B|nr:Jag N-terminal domain-containing protein [uncultured Helicobacter sp.]